MTDNSNKHIVQDATRAAIKSESPQLYILSLLYFLVGILSFYEIIRTLRSCRWAWKNTTTRFRVITLSFSSLTMIIRGFFTLVYFQWNNIEWAYFWYFKFPIWLQFCTFSLYILYLAKTLYLTHGKETRIKRWLDIIFIITQIIFLGLLIVFCYLDINLANSNIKYTNYEKYSLAYTAILFFVLVILLFPMGITFYRQLLDFSLVKIKKKRMKFVMILVSVNGAIFFFRSIWTVTSLFNANSLNKKFANWLKNKEYNKYDSAQLGFYLLTEIFPAFLLFLVLHLNLSSEKTMFVQEENFLLSGDSDLFGNENITNQDNFKDGLGFEIN